MPSIVKLAVRETQKKLAARTLSRGLGAKREFLHPTVWSDGKHIRVAGVSRFRINMGVSENKNILSWTLDSRLGIARTPAHYASSSSDPSC